MESIMTAPGVIKSATRIYVTPEDVSALMGCRRSMAYEMIKKINKSSVFHKQIINNPFSPIL